MQLKIAKFSSADLARAAIRCRQDLSSVLGQGLDIPGIVTLIASDLPGVRDANCAFAPENLSEEQIDEVEQSFARRGSLCLRWIASNRHPLLRDRTKSERSLAVLRLSRWQRNDESSPIMVLQARAALPQMRQLLTQMHDGDAVHVRADERRLEDPKFELLLGLQRGRPIGCAGLLISGDSAMVTMHYTRPDCRGQGIERTLIDRAIELAARSTLKHVLMTVDETDAALMEFYAGVGFDRAATLVEYDAA